MTDRSRTPLKEGELLAAADLGSNSFHLVVARCEHGEPRVIDRLRDSVRLAGGLRADGSLDAAHRQRALACLARFGQRIADLPRARVRSVATNAVRQLRAPQSFLSAAEAALGKPIEVVSGREEARLIFMGVAHGLPASREHRLVIDIGGGSTEFIVGRSLEPLLTESVQVGCVASTLRFFPKGKLSRKRWQRARQEIGLLLQQFSEEFRGTGWQEAYGSSGSAKAIGSLVRNMNLGDDGITAPALATIRDTMLEQGSIDQLNLPGLSDDRRAIIAGGVVILEAAFEALGIERMKVCETAMREGLLWDLVGRVGGTDPRMSSIDSLATRYGADKAQAQRVESTALSLFDQVTDDWQLDDDDREWLLWATRVHEIGLAIAHSQHHRHAGYILRNADLAGFSKQEQQLLAAVVECHRRKPDRNLMSALPPRYKMRARHVAALLRLAVLLRRGRRQESMPDLHLHAEHQHLQLSMPGAWLQQHPLTEADLAQEQVLLSELGIRLDLSPT